MNYNELVNTVININSLNELEALKNSLLTANQNNISQQLNLIRILSLEEYKKYIINGTCDGAVAKNDIDVYHYDNTGKNTSYAVNTGCWNSSDINALNNYLNHKNNVKVVNAGGRVGVVNLYHEILENNSNDKNTIYSQQQLNIDFIVHYYGGSHVCTNRGPYSLNSSKDYNISKSITSFYIDSTHEGSTYISFFVMSNFRPVLQYTDNNKSLNIFN